MKPFVLALLIVFIFLGGPVQAYKPVSWEEKYGPCNREGDWLVCENTKEVFKYSVPKPSGNRRYRYWYEFINKIDDGSLSLRVYGEFDCINKTFKALQVKVLDGWATPSQVTQAENALLYKTTYFHPETGYAYYCNKVMAEGLE